MRCKIVSNQDLNCNIFASSPGISEKEGRKRKKGAEGVGFEPTVGCPTLDFESSALNRTQPPFHFQNRQNARTPNFQHPTPNATAPGDADPGVRCSAGRFISTRGS